MDTKTTLQRAADLLLQQRTDSRSLAEFLQTHRANGLSYERITRELDHETGGAVIVSTKTVRRWLADLTESDAA